MAIGNLVAGMVVAGKTAKRGAENVLSVPVIALSHMLGVLTFGGCHVTQAKKNNHKKKSVGG